MVLLNYYWILNCISTFVDMAIVRRGYISNLSYAENPYTEAINSTLRFFATPNRSVAFASSREKIIDVTLRVYGDPSERRGYKPATQSSCSRMLGLVTR